MNWYLKVLGDFDDFSGRARRTEYWMFSFFNLIFLMLAVILDYFIVASTKGMNFSPIALLYSLITFVPSISVGVRRLHDIGKSGWMLLITFIPLIGSIWLFILFITDGDPKKNEYGENPKNKNIEPEIKQDSIIDHVKEESQTGEKIKPEIIPNLEVENKKDDYLKRKELKDEKQPDLVVDNDDSKKELDFIDEKYTNVSNTNEKHKSNPFSFAIKVLGIGLLSMSIIIISLIYFLSADAGKKKTVKKISEIDNILKKRKNDLGEYPNELQEIIGINPFRKEINIDYWGNNFYYKKAEDGQDFILISTGEDGTLGTSDDIDINTIP